MEVPFLQVENGDLLKDTRQDRYDEEKPVMVGHFGEN